MEVKVVGAGLAGCEAAWQLANRGLKVTLCEMKPRKMSPAHHSPDFAELVCSNSLRSDALDMPDRNLCQDTRRTSEAPLGWKAFDACPPMRSGSQPGTDCCDSRKWCRSFP